MRSLSPYFQTYAYTVHNSDSSWKLFTICPQCGGQRVTWALFDVGEWNPKWRPRKVLVVKIVELYMGFVLTELTQTISIFCVRDYTYDFRWGEDKLTRLFNSPQISWVILIIGMYILSNIWEIKIHLAHFTWCTEYIVSDW